MYTFADDTTLVITADTESELQALAQSELGNLVEYFHKLDLVPNASKTVYTSFWPRGNEMTLKVGRKAIKQVAKTPLLGIVVKNDLKWGCTISKIVGKLQRVMRMFRYLRTITSERTMVRMYYAHAYPHLIYAIAVWGTPKQNITFVKAHKKIIRIITSNPPETHTAPIMKRLKILNLSNLYILRACLEAHPFIHADTCETHMGQTRTQPRLPQNKHNTQPQHTSISTESHPHSEHEQTFRQDKTSIASKLDDDQTCESMGLTATKH